MAWLQLHFEIDPSAAAALENALLASGALSITLSDAADNPILEPELDTTPLWQSVRLSALFPDPEAVDAVTATIAAHRQAPLPPWRAERLDDQDWVRAWLADYRPLSFGRLMICPTGFEAEPGTVAVHLDPGLAFGTGTHPTTALCLQWLAEQDLQGQDILDYGCGSGILAIAALCLGARQALGVDHDPQALLASRDNAGRNGIADTRLRLLTPADCEREQPQAGIVLANILAAPLIHLADVLKACLAPGGTLVMSGILAEQAEQVMAAYTPALVFEPPALRDGWARLTARHHPGCAG